MLYKHGVISCLFHNISQHFAEVLEAKVFCRSTQYEIFLDARPTEMQQLMLPQEGEDRHNLCGS